MSYIEQSLGRNETLHYGARFPTAYFVGGWSILGLTAIFALVLAVSNLVWVAVVVAVIGLGLYVSVMLPVWTTEIFVTTHRFVYKRGFLQRTTKELQLRTIEEVNLQQGLFGRLFNFGRVELRGTGVDDIRLPLLAEPIVLERAIQEAIGATQPNVPIAAARTTAEPVAPSGEAQQPAA